MRVSESKRRALARLEAAARARSEANRSASAAAANAQANAAWSAFSAAAVALFPERPVSFVGSPPFVMQDAPSVADLGGFAAFTAWVHRLADDQATPDDDAVLDELPADVADGLRRHWSMSPRDAACVMSAALRSY